MSAWPGSLPADATRSELALSGRARRLATPLLQATKLTSQSGPVPSNNVMSLAAAGDM